MVMEQYYSTAIALTSLRVCALIGFGLFLKLRPSQTRNPVTGKVEHNRLAKKAKNLPGKPTMAPTMS